MESYDIKQDSGASEIFRFIKEKHDNPGENGIQILYDTITPSYDESIKGILYSGPRKVVSILEEYCSNKNVSILECGSGTGLIGEQLCKSGYKNVTGVDVSQKSLDVAEKKGIYKKLLCAEILPKGMPFSDDEFDVLICSGCIAPGHISPECFPEWTRIVKPDNLETGGHMSHEKPLSEVSAGGFVVIVFRRCYVEPQKDREYLYSAKLGESFKLETRKLEESKRWVVVLRQTFPGYINEDGFLNDGIAIVCRVLQSS